MAVVPPPLALSAFNFLSSPSATIAALLRAQPTARRHPWKEIPMRSLALSVTVLAGLAAAPAFAQSAVPLNQQGVPPGANPATGARPGNDIGTGMSHADGHAREQHRRVRHTLADRTEPAEPTGRTGCQCGRLSARGAGLAAGGPHRRGAAVAGDGADAAAGSLGADGPDQQPERQSCGDRRCRRR